MLWLLAWLRSLAEGVQRFSVGAARRASASALQRFTLAQCAAALALVALTFALLVARELSMPSGKTAAESDGTAPFDAGAPGERDVGDAAQREPVGQVPDPAGDRPRPRGLHVTP